MNPLESWGMLHSGVIPQTVRVIQNKMMRRGNTLSGHINPGCLKWRVMDEVKKIGDKR